MEQENQLLPKRLCETYKIFQIVQAVTTRTQRKDDITEQYLHITKEEFKKLEEEKKLLIKSEYMGESYGITYEALQQVINGRKIPLLITIPQSTHELEIGGDRKLYYLTVFLDAPDEMLDERLKERGVEISENIKKQRKNDREYIGDCLYRIKNLNSEDTTKLLHYLWHYRNIGGMLPKKIIELMIKCGMLLENANENNIQGASYDLTIGEEYFHKGEIKTLDDKKPFIIMKAGDYILVSSKEIANLPRDIAGRFDITVGLFCKGVILSNGPQIDPGFRGKLFCLLFNTSSEKVQLKLGQHFTTIEFDKLIEPTVPYKGTYQNKLQLKDYLPEIVKESAINKIITDIEELKKEKLLLKILPLVLSSFAILLSIIVVLLKLFGLI